MLLRALPLLLLFPLASQVSAQPSRTAYPDATNTQTNTAAVTPAPSAEPNGWSTGHSVDPYTGQRFPYASLRSSATAQQQPAILTLLCSRYHTIVNLYWGQPLTGEGMTVRYTTAPADNTVESRWEVSADQRTLIYPSDGNQLFVSLLTAPTVTIEAQTENGQLLMATFTTQGANDALQDVVNVCGE
ncbi:hypothetical protein ACLPHM_05105 [Paenalcaligenes sp. Me131]|uniref:hypothetical protein n=1 Tax=Paenalcaligenes sp. Me131 TaxID=3392636 RepID=UPI003D29C527